MSTPKERLSHLIELAAQGSAARPQLAHELSDVLLDWPIDYPAAARLPFEALLEKAVREVDRETRAVIAARFARRVDAPVELLNELFFAAPAEMKDEIVARNAIEPHRAASGAPAADDASVLAHVRKRDDFPASFARALAVSEPTASEIVSDGTGRSLALACKAAGLGRATFSAIAVLTDRGASVEEIYARLDAFDAVPQHAAENMLSFWRMRPVPEPAPDISEAAE